MVFCNAGHERDWIAATNSSTGLTEEQKTLLVAELTDDPDDRGYATPIASANWQTLQAKLHEPYTYTIAAHERDRATMPQAEFQVLASRIAAAAGQGSAPQQAAWAAMKDAIQIACMFVTVTLNDPQVQAMVSGLNVAGLLTPEQLLQLTKEPQEEATEARPSRASVLFGYGYVVEVSDLAQLRAEELI